MGDGALAATELERYAAEMQKRTGLHPTEPEAAELIPQPEQPVSVQKSGLFSPDMLTQLEAVFSKMAEPLRLQLLLDDRPVSRELRQYVQELERLTAKLSVEFCREAGRAISAMRPGLPCRWYADGIGLSWRTGRT